MENAIVETNEYKLNIDVNEITEKFIRGALMVIQLYSNRKSGKLFDKEKLAIELKDSFIKKILKEKELELRQRINFDIHNILPESNVHHYLNGGLIFPFEKDNGELRINITWKNNELL